MSWSLDTVVDWVKGALLKVGYDDELADWGASSVRWLQQNDAPGVAAMAQHIDFLSAYQLTPRQDGDAKGTCPIQLGHRIRQEQLIAPQTFPSVRQPLLLIPALANNPGLVRWDQVVLSFSEAALEQKIEHDNKTLRKLHVTSADVVWEAKTAATEDWPETDPTTEVPSRDLVYVKTLQHYAGTLPPREPLDGAEAV